MIQYNDRFGFEMKPIEDVCVGGQNGGCPPIFTNCPLIISVVVTNGKDNDLAVSM